jgi:hypothetical protein
MNAVSAYRMPTGELIFSTSQAGQVNFRDLPWKLLNSEFFGFLTAFVVSLSALAVAGG